MHCSCGRGKDHCLHPAVNTSPNQDGFLRGLQISMFYRLALLLQKNSQVLELPIQHSLHCSSRTLYDI